MRNLKKILALVLAMMMVLSMMVTANAAFVDADDITGKYTEAVEVLSGIGVIDGVKNADGTYSFNPQGTLTRAAAAKIISYILEGSLDGIDTVADSVTNPFNDLPSWAEPYVLYAYNEGVVVGDGNGNYSPSRELTGYEFGKMLLIAAGICDNDDFANSWKTVVATELKTAKLWDSKDFALSKKLTREEACYLAFNAMLYTATGSEYYVARKTDASDVKIDKSDLVMFTLAGYICDGPYNSYTGSLAAKVFGLDQKNDQNSIGMNGYFWYCDVDGNGEFDLYKDVVASDFISTDTVVGVYGVGDTYKNISDDLGKKTYTVNLYTNGDAQSPATKDITATTASSYKVSEDTSLWATVVVTADGKYNVLFVNEVLCTATSAPITNKDDENYGLYTWTFKNGSTEVAKTIDSKDAYSTKVAYLVVANKVGTALSIEEAKTVVGTLTGTAAGYIRVDGEIINKANASVAVSSALGDIVVCYLNSAGDLIAVVTYSAASVTTEYDGYAYLSTMEVSGAKKSATGLIGSSDAYATGKAIITTVEGETKTVDVATRINTSTKAPQYYLNKWVDISADGKAYTVKDSDSNDLAGWVGYTVEDGMYYFDVLATNTVVSGAAKGNATVTINTGTYYLNADTVISMIAYNVDTEEVEIFAFSGYSSSTAAYLAYLNNSTGGCYNYVADKNGVLSSITMLYTTNAEEEVTYAVFKGVGETVLGGITYYNFYIGGELKSYPVTADSVVNGLTDGDVVTFTTNAKGKINDVTKATLATEVIVKLIAADGSYFIDTDNTVHYLASEYVVYDKLENYAGAELTVGAKIQTASNSYDKVVCIIINGYVED